jgi:putative restriction endonuclease
LEGGKKKIYTTTYERNKKLRNDAIAIHGYTCKVCDFNFKEVYGLVGEGYIHVHHLKPVSSNNKKTTVDVHNDLVVVCANCHSMIHRKKNTLLSIDELKKMMRKKASH